MRDDDGKKPCGFMVGENVELLSVDELELRIAALKKEIIRLEAEVATKQASRSAADQVFKS